MADPNDAGTPQAVTPVSESAGTGGQVSDGSEAAGKPVDPALAMAWKAKAERFNVVEQELADTKARLAAAQQAQYGQAVDPMAQMVAGLRERAQYGDSDAAAQLSILTLTATQQAENNLTNEMVKGGIPGDKWDVVQGLVRQSGYRMSVAQALQLARGSEVPDLAKQLEAERQKNAALEKALHGQTVGGGSPGNPAATTPAAVGGGDAPLMTVEEYNAALKSLPPEEAKALRDKGVRFKK